MEALGTLVGQLGFPIAIAVFFLWQNKQLNDKFVELAIQSSVDSKATTQALKDAIEIKERNISQLARSEQLILRLETKLGLGD